MIKAHDIYKRFDNLEVLKGVSFEVKKGEMVAIVGQSGAGKTTLLQIIGTLDKPNSGSIIIGGQDIAQLSEKELSHFRNQEIGFIFQFHQLLPEFTALENVMLPALIGHTEHHEAKQRATDILERLKLGERLHHKPNELSGGERQRVAAARALINNPSIILADEPSGSLDSNNKQELHKLLCDMRDQFKQTIIIVTHDNELAQIANRIVRMQDGKIIS
ncbi:MAG: ABC transporter ATP-binding protein [Paludibacteraceae bacterium]|nr:ABC transporter ATP-binding protein [Paludibacteraceae bacterium]MBO7233643.1 ABC transporter ATP-binding protein [Paludibacteraceae bacterium]